MDRVLHINDYAMATGGGAEVILTQSVALLRQAGVRVEVFTSADLATARRTPLRFVNNSLARTTLAAKLEEFRPDVVHLHNYYHVLSPGILVAIAEHKRRHRLRVVMTAHDYHLVCPNAGGSWFRWWTRRREIMDARQLDSLRSLLAYRWDDRSCLHSLLRVLQFVWNYRWHQRHRVIDLVICPSRFVQTMLAPTGLPTCFLPHPIPPLPSTRGRRDGPLRLIFVGRLEPEKGLNDFLQLLPADFDAHLTVVGAGSEEGRCRATCEQRGWSRQVKFTGRLPHTEALAQIARSHVLVQPSRVLETYGLTLIEALAQGTSVLAANRGPAREIVETTGAGFLYEPDDRDNLARQLQIVRAQYTNGTLNRFDIEPFLDERSEQRYLEGLRRVYEQPAGIPALS